MISGLFVLVLLGGSLAMKCGGYTTQCVAAGAIYVQYTFEVSVDSKNHATTIYQYERQYTDSQCKDKQYLEFKTKLSTRYISEITGKSEDYSVTYKSVDMMIKDSAVFKAYGFTCSRELKEGSSYSLSSVECDQANIPYTSLYRSSIGTTIDSTRFKLSEDSITLFGLTAQSTSIAGCNGTIALIVIGCIVAGVIIIALLVVCIVRKCKKA